MKFESVTRKGIYKVLEIKGFMVIAEISESTYDIIEMHAHIEALDMWVDVTNAQSLRLAHQMIEAYQIQTYSKEKAV